MAEDKRGAPTMPKGSWCPIGPLSLHTFNFEEDECIWCGPNVLCSKPGRWVSIGNDMSRWSAVPAGDVEGAK